MDIFEEDDLPIPTDDDADINVSSIKPTNGKRAALAGKSDDGVPISDDETTESESFEDILAAELQELEEGDDYFYNPDELSS